MRRYHSSNTTSDLSGGQDFNFRLDLSPITTTTTTVAHGNAATRINYLYTPPLHPGPKIDGGITPFHTLRLGGATPTARLLLRESATSFLLVGAFTSINGTTRNRIARLSNDGALDTSFDPNANGQIFFATVDSDDKILIGGAFTEVGGTARNRIARLNSDGTLDTTFNPNANANVLHIQIQSDDKIIICGGFTTVGGTTRNRIARLNSDGSLDTSFNPNANQLVRKSIILSDGKILICGGFTTVGGTTRNSLARLNSDGTLDTAYAPASIDDGVIDTIVLASGKVLIAGFFLTVGGTSRTYIARLNSDGTLDTTFNANVSGPIDFLLELANNQIYVAGNPQSFGEVLRSRIARIDANGALDRTFAADANEFVARLHLDDDGRLFAVGSFTQIGGAGDNAGFALIPTTPVRIALNITGANTNISSSLQIERISSNNTLISSSNADIIDPLSPTGVYNYYITPVGLGLFDTTDRLRIKLETRNKAAHSSNSFTFGHSGTFIETGTDTIIYIF
jgi:uncharacterized delta-60 repeat protein